MKRNSTDSAPLLAQLTYKLGEITYVPHFRNSDVYVGPGYPRFTKQRYSEFELVAKGAVQESMPLWTRGKYGMVDDANL